MARGDPFGPGGTLVSAEAACEFAHKAFPRKRPRRRAKYPARSENLVPHQHAEAIRDFPELVRHDPFGRLLVAQASCAGLRLLTADQILLGLGRDFIVDANR